MVLLKAKTLDGDEIEFEFEDVVRNDKCDRVFYLKDDFGFTACDLDSVEVVSDCMK